MWNLGFRLALGLTLGGLVTGPTQAQQDDGLRLGARIRVLAGVPEPTQHTGTYQGRSGSTVLVSTGTETLSVPVETIRQIERSAGRPWNLAGGIIGALLGAGVGGLLGCAANRDSYGVLCGGQDDTKVIVGATVGGVAGGLAGALLFRRERWQPVVLPGVTP